MDPTLQPAPQSNPRVQPRGKPQGSTPGLNPGLRTAQNAPTEDRRTNPHAWPEGAPRHVPYLMLKLPADEEAAARRFIEKHGHPPDFIFETADAFGVLWVGPIIGAHGGAPEGE